MIDQQGGTRLKKQLKKGKVSRKEAREVKKNKQTGVLFV
jgi:hypothetical protein